MKKSTILQDILTLSEAAKLWGKNESTIRERIRNGAFKEYTDYRKSGRITLITKEAMERVYGKRI